MIIKRDLEIRLHSWKTSRQRRPLLLRGARQVGKSTLITAWGKQNFDNMIIIDFEREPRMKEAVRGQNIKQLLETIALFAAQPIIPGKTLLVFDEIQESLPAIMLLRYFFEEIPELHILGAGSLLELALRSESISMPVGRVEFLHLLPISFAEFLGAVGEQQLKNYLETLGIEERPEEAIHRKLLGLLKTYALIGGMPAVVEEYASTQNINRCRELQNALLLSYRNDFGKYASLAKRKYLEAVFSRTPDFVGQKVMYRAIDPHAKSTALKEAIELLSLVGALHPVYQTKGAGLPFEAGKKANFYKLLFLDVGLMQRALGLESELAESKQLLDVYRGAVAEQLVGQELLASLDSTDIPKLYYWAREARGSSAEVDYLISVQGKIVPVEVKSGASGSLKSLWLFTKEYQAPLGIRISERPLSFDGQLLSLPLYLASQALRLANALAS